VDQQRLASHQIKATVKELEAFGDACW